MTIYYSLTFLLLAGEMITFCVLVSPLPYAVRKRMFRFLSESPIVAKVAYALKISFIFVGILFMDALQRMFRVTAESDLAKQHGASHADVRTETNFAARKFYSQRNVYLTGFTLFLSLVLTRTFYMVLDLIHTQEEYAKLKNDTASNSKNKLASEDQRAQLEQLKKDVEKREKELQALKSQATSQARAYDELADKYNKETGQTGANKRKD